jgi:hypothetical protein
MDIFKHLYPNIPNSGYTSESDYVANSYSLEYQTDGNYKFLLFDQRLYTTENEFARANLDLTGALYIPKQCFDGTIESCKLNVVFGSCVRKYENWWSYFEKSQISGSLR